MYVIRTNSRRVRAYKIRRDSFKAAWEGSGRCGAKEMKVFFFELQQKETFPNETCEYKREKEIGLTRTDGNIQQHAFWTLASL